MWGYALTGAGSNYTLPPIATIASPNVQALATVTVSGGGLDTFTVTNAGEGYVTVPTVTITGTTVANFTGQAYKDTSSPHEVDPATVSEGSGNVINATNFTYANVDGASTMLSGGIPKVDTGVGGAYTLGVTTVPLYTGSRTSIQDVACSACAKANGIREQSIVCNRKTS